MSWENEVGSYQKNQFEDNRNSAYTLDQHEASGEPYAKGMNTKTHSDGWTIRAVINEDYYYWINYFEAEHPEYGRVWGDFENTVHADSEEGFERFFENHPPYSWDYMDI